MTPWPIDEKAGSEHNQNETHTCKGEFRRIKSVKWIDNFYDTCTPQKSNHYKDNEKYDPNCIRQCKRHSVLGENSFPILGVSIQSENKVLQRSERTGPTAKNLIG